MYSVYILQLIDDSYYVGFTENIERRLKEHRLGMACVHTKKNSYEAISVVRKTTRSNACKSTGKRNQGLETRKERKAVARNFRRSGQNWVVNCS